MLILILITVFLLKHFICDYPLQRWRYMYVNKGTYGHFGGILHALIHAIATSFIILAINPAYALFGFFVDFILHYHIDWAKMKLCKVFNLKPDNSEWYWHLLGLDQLLHGLTYVFIIWVVLYVY